MLYSNEEVKVWQGFIIEISLCFRVIVIDLDSSGCIKGLDKVEVEVLVKYLNGFLQVFFLYRLKNGKFLG